MPYMLTSISVALPAVGSEFSIDAILLNWVATSYILASAMFLIPFGKIADIYGRKKIFTYGFIIFIVTSLLSALSTSAAMLILFRFLQGVGSAMISSTAVAIITSVTPITERGKALGVNVAVVYFGQAVGPYIGGLLTQYFGWRSIFYSILPVCVLVVALIIWKIDEEWVEEKALKFNYASAAIYSITFVMIMYGFSLVPEISSLWLIGLGAIGFIYYIRREAKVDNPLLNISLFKNNRVFAFSNLASLISYSATYAIIFLMSLYLQYIQMLTPQMAGLVLMSKAIVQGAFSPLAGSLSDRFDPKLLASIGMGLSGVSLFMLVFIGPDTSLVFIVVAMVIIGLGLGLFVSPNTNAIMSSVEKEYYGVSSAILATMRQVGQLSSMAIVMVLFASIIGKVEITPEYYPLLITATRISFVVFGVLSILGIFFSLARGKLERAG